MFQIANKWEPPVQFDEIGYWSEVKLDIIKDYARAYSTIMASQRNPAFYHMYIDGFSGSGVHISKTSGEFVLGSPLNALNIAPPFKEYYFIDLDGSKIAELQRVVGERENVHIFEGDCNEILLKSVFPNVRYRNHRRALCLLDSYGLHLKWQVIQLAGRVKSIDLFLNFPIMDMNRNALWRYPEKVEATGIERMTTFWGDESWRGAAYRQQALFDTDEGKTATNIEIAKAFQKRLSDIAHFAHVADPLPMRNSRGAVVYYLFFASQKPVSLKIIKDIFRKYRDRGR
ncbi:MAG: three-Cys-motif partner protein TcmP [Candidatus Zixiibacteriota bacterium]|nr:MAG: three-Cys-motif partner protein TcmP [candidate division Zixibacteria bacterium]